MCVCVPVFRGMEIMTSSWDFRICPFSHSHPPPSIFLSVCLSLCFLSNTYKTHTCSLCAWVEQPFHSDSCTERERELCEKKGQSSKAASQDELHFVFQKRRCRIQRNLLQDFLFHHSLLSRCYFDCRNKFLQVLVYLLLLSIVTNNLLQGTVMMKCTLGCGSTP